MANRETKLNIVVDAQNKATAGFRSVERDLTGLETKTNRLSNVLNGIRTAGIAAAGGMTFGAVNAVKAAANYEQTSIAFETMIGSADEAEKTLADLAEFAAKTPFELGQLEEASKRLLAYDTSADDLIPTLKMLGDISAGVGMDKLPQLILAFGQVQSATKLTGAELRQFSEAGVPLLGALADHFGVSKEAVIEMVSAGEVSFEDMKAALSGLTDEGSRFYNLMEKQAGTLGGLWSNLKDQVEQTSRVFGEKLIPLIKPILEDLISIAEAVRDFSGNFGQLANEISSRFDIFLILRGYWEEIVETYNLYLKPALAYLRSQFAGNSEEIKIALTFFGKLLAFITAETLIAGIKLLAGAIRLIGAAFDMIITPISAFIRVVDKAIGRLETLLELASGMGLVKKISSFFGGGRAAGGPVSAGTTYMVGEQGPEMFVPKTSGTIIPNNRLNTSSQIIINITGNTLLSDDVAEHIGDSIISRLKLSAAL